MRPMSRAGPRYLEVRLTHAQLRRNGRRVLQDLSWTIRPGERWVLAGGNGAGKTQLLKLVAGPCGPRRPRARCAATAAAGSTGARRRKCSRRDRLSGGGAAGQVPALRLEHDGRAPRRHRRPPHRHSARRALRRRPAPRAPRPRRTRRRAPRGAPLPVALLRRAAGGLLARALASRPRLLLLDEVLTGSMPPTARACSAGWRAAAACPGCSPRTALRTCRAERPRAGARPRTGRVSRARCAARRSARGWHARRSACTRAAPHAGWARALVRSERRARLPGRQPCVVRHIARRARRRVLGRARPQRLGQDDAAAHAVRGPRCRRREDASSAPAFPPACRSSSSAGAWASSPRTCRPSSRGSSR